MKIIPPITITDAILTSSTVPETDYSAWNSSTSYVIGDYVILTTGYHKIYKALTNNTNKNPATNPTDWEEVSATNRWKMFDSMAQSATIGATPVMPLQHARDAEAVARYCVEPYVVAAEVYGAAPHVGRGGWTWYTGSSGWMYRVLLESLLGFSVRGGESLQLAPCVPDDWPEFRLDYRWPGETTCWNILARNPHHRGRGVRAATLDGTPLAVAAGVARIPVHHDGRAHRVELCWAPTRATHESLEHHSPDSRAFSRRRDVHPPSWTLEDRPLSDFSFPTDFLWGAATSGIGPRDEPEGHPEACKNFKHAAILPRP